MCAFFSSDSERLQLVADFLSQGSSANRRCALATTPEVFDAVRKELERRGAHARLGCEPSSLVRVDYADDPRKQLVESKSEFEAGARGVSELRVVGDMCSGALWAHAPFDDIMDYEAEYQKLSRHYRVKTLCLFDVRVLSGVQASRILRVHPDAVRPPVALVAD